MKKRLPTPIKDGLIGLAFGAAAIIPGIAGGSILLIAKAYKKVVNAISHLFSKQFGRNFLTLLPFGVGALISIILLSIPLNYAIEYLLFGTVCLFVGLIIGSLPGVIDNVRNEKRSPKYFVILGIFLIFTAFIGVFSVILGSSPKIESLFAEVPWYLYLIIFGVGLIASAGFIVPGFSGSMLLLAVCFYGPILKLFSTENFGQNISLLAAFAAGAFIGLIGFSKLMNYFLDKHKVGTYYASIGMVIGSLVAVFVNSKMFEYLQGERFGLADQITGPILFVVGVMLAYLFVRYIRNHPELNEDAEN